MSKLVVSWTDNKGVEYSATTLFDPDTGKFWDWDSNTAKYVLRLEPTQQPETSEGGDGYTEAELEDLRFALSKGMRVKPKEIRVKPDTNKQDTK